MVQKRNYSVDIVKLIGAYVIVFLHFPPNGFAGLIVLTISRFAVPFFFIVSGYYSYQKERASIRHIKKLIRLFVVSEILYFIVNAFQNGPVHWLHSTYTKAALWNFLLFQIPFASTHLWFLLALMLCYLFVMIFQKSLLAYSKRGYIIGLGLLIINLFLGEILSA